jgi:hypothetical protein
MEENERGQKEVNLGIMPLFWIPTTGPNVSSCALSSEEEGILIVHNVLVIMSIAMIPSKKWQSQA